MKKIGTIALAALLTASVIGSYSALAQEEAVQVINEKKEEATNYMRFSGKITETESGDNEIRLTVENEDKMLMILRINDESQLYNSGTAKSLTKSDLKKGATIEAFYDKNKPMILIYPPTLTPELVIVKDESVSGEVKVGKFDKNFLSLDGKLKLNIGKDTMLLNQQGKAIKETELHGEELIVFYAVTTRSLPPQTTPSKIITLNHFKDDTLNVQEIIANDHYMKNGVKMIPLRKVAEHLGYKVLSQPKVDGALVTLQNSSFTIKRGEKTYGYNRSIRNFEVAPELRDMTTYVSEDFLELLIQQ
ncbi:stalk domain-containing protein [Sporosarcina limicola]|uniref:Copper amine oxidase-like N-terminal domain-containing protein n=1 Tax=Sporosarcina limicola TaxID=34101 RepID=A0A927R6W3_9BACL|nr:stalk domain-containing protein [Sporosarcina limicola]MBE1555359.1 hypothetical protein [Sporosarcina limicola]